MYAGNNTQFLSKLIKRTKRKVIFMSNSDNNTKVDYKSVDNDMI